MRTHGTTEESEAKPTALVTGGVFALSRNPLHVSLISVLAGMSVTMDFAWLLIGCFVLWAVLHFVVIPGEEQILAREFPDDPAAYRLRVRRWPQTERWPDPLFATREEVVGD